jgi:hypothetical protein
MKGECLSILKEKKKFQLKKNTANAKSQHQKIKFHIFWCVYDKASSVFKRLDWLFIKEKLDQHYDLC